MLPWYGDLGREAGQKCLAEDRTCNTCGDRGNFGMSKLCKKKKKKATRRVKEEWEETRLLHDYVAKTILT